MLIVCSAKVRLRVETEWWGDPLMQFPDTPLLRNSIDPFSFTVYVDRFGFVVDIG